MDQVVRHSWMVGILTKHLVEDGDRLLRIDERVFRIRTPRQQRHAIKHRRLVVFGILPVHLLHRFGEFAVAGLVIAGGFISIVVTLLIFAIENREGINVVAFALSFRVQGLRLLN